MILKIHGVSKHKSQLIKVTVIEVKPQFSIETPAFFK